MSKECHTFEHTADIGLAAQADTLPELFEALAQGLADFLCPRELVEPTQTREVSVVAEDHEALAIDFLSAVLNVIQADHFMVAWVEATHADETSITAKLLGQPYDPARHQIHTEVKAVTYHLLKIEKTHDGWRGTVILDL
jgi:SHS2 domain-containing protein